MESKERIKQLVSEIEGLDLQIELLKEQRALKYKELGELSPPKPMRVAVNSPAQVAKNQLIIAETKRMVGEAQARKQAEINKYSSIEEREAFEDGLNYK